MRFSLSHIIPSVELPINTLVHLGAGRCTELEMYLEQKPNYILLIEADPELAGELVDRTAKLSNARVVNAAVAGHDGEVIFYRYNLSDLNSLHKPNTYLLELFPGLRCIDKISANTSSPEEILSPMYLDTEQNNYLIIDIPGEELSVIKSLNKAQLLHKFRYIQLYCGEQPLYENCEASSTILNWLENAGFETTLKHNSEDPDRPCFYLRYSKIGIKIKEQENLLQKLHETRNEVTKLAEERLITINQLKQHIDTLTKQLKDKEINIIQLEKSKNKVIKLAEERLNTLDQLKKELDEQSFRQNILDEELIKAEAQIKLISDILIREKVF